MAEDWEPTPRVRAEVQAEHGWNDAQTAAVVADVRDYWLGRGRPMADWDAVFRGYARKPMAAQVAEGVFRPGLRPAGGHGGRAGQRSTLGVILDRVAAERGVERR